MDHDLFSFLDWNPDDEERSPDAAFVAYKLAQEQRSGGDYQAALATLDRGLEAAGLDDRSDGELAALLTQKAVILSQVGQHDEALALFQRVVELSRDGSEPVQVLGIVSRIGIALLLEERGEQEEELAELLDVASSYAWHDERAIRALAIFAHACRIRVLLELNRVDEARAEWRSIRESHASDSEPSVRAAVAAAGKTMSHTLLDKKETRMVVATADEVMALFRIETDPEIRAAVVIAMWARLTALRKRARFISFYRGLRDFMRFLGSEPEPEVVEALREFPRGESIVRNARIFNS